MHSQTRVAFLHRFIKVIRYSKFLLHIKYIFLVGLQIMLDSNLNNRLIYHFIHVIALTLLVSILPENSTLQHVPPFMSRVTFRILTNKTNFKNRPRLSWWKTKSNFNKHVGKFYLGDLLFTYATGYRL